MFTLKSTCQPQHMHAKSARQLIMLIGLVAFLITFLSEMVHSESFSITSLNSTIYIAKGKCDLEVSETFVYEFNGTYSSIKRRLQDGIDNAYGRSISLLSNNGYIIQSAFEIIDEKPFLLFNLNPPTPKGQITTISFTISYSVSSTKKLFTKFVNPEETNYFSVLYYYDGPMNSLKSTFSFSPELSFTKKPFGANADVIDQRTITFSRNYTTYLQPYVTFYPTDTNSFDKCSKIIGNQVAETSNENQVDVGIIVIAVTMPLFFIFLFLLFGCMFFLIKKPKNPFSVKVANCLAIICPCDNKNEGNPDNERGSTGYKEFRAFNE